MNHETLQALYALDVAEVGEEEAAKRWEVLTVNNDEEEEFATVEYNGYPMGWLGKEYRRKPGIPWPKVMTQDIGINPETVDKLLKTIRYLIGIAERGCGRQIKENETPEKFVLDYVKSLESKPEWPADAPEWANYMATDANGRCMFFENKPVIQPTGRLWDTNLGRRDVFTIRNYPGWEPSLIERPKPKDYCGVCGEWLGGPVECCGESHLKPPVTKDEAVAVRAARKPVLKKIDWSKMRNNVDVTWYAHPQTLESQFPSPWIAWNCDEHTRGNPLPDGLVVDLYDMSIAGLWRESSQAINWNNVTRFRIVGIQEGWE